ncbi:hypothetical protein ACFC1R_23405 [Kitasatospora sp. NPDC056138]|uniref:hypothetical protein n=1 Tax=Kitasatospora sp. NPDC056138 TaxID=3345724 RepID=UPI0035D66D48
MAPTLTELRSSAGVEYAALRAPMDSRAQGAGASPEMRKLVLDILAAESRGDLAAAEDAFALIRDIPEAVEAVRRRLPRNGEHLADEIGGCE